MKNEMSMHERGLRLTPVYRKRGTENSEEGNVIAGSAKPFYEQLVEKMVRSSRKTVELRESGQEGRNSCLHALHFRRVFRDSDVADCAVLKDMNLTTVEVSSHRALNRKLNELRRQELTDIKDLATKNKKPKCKLKTAKESIARLERVVRRNEMRQGTKRRTEERESSTSGGGTQKLHAVQK